MFIIGIDISEKNVRVALPVKSSIRIITLEYGNDLDFSDPVEIAKRLSHLQRAVKKEQKFIIQEAVVSLPLYRSISDWARVKKAAFFLGIEIKRTLPNITAAAFYAAGKNPQKDKITLCYGFYNGRFSFGLYLVDQGVCQVLCLRNSYPKEKFRKFLSGHTSLSDRFKVSGIYKVVNIGEGRPTKDFRENILSAVLKSKNKRKKPVKNYDYPVLGALLQGAVLSGRIKDMLLLDITPWGYGITITREEDFAYSYDCGLKLDVSRKRCTKCRKKVDHTTAMLIEKAGPKKYAPWIKRNRTIPTKKRDLLLCA